MNQNTAIAAELRRLAAWLDAHTEIPCRHVDVTWVNGNNATTHGLHTEHDPLPAVPWTEHDGPVRCNTGDYRILRAVVDGVRLCAFPAVAVPVVPFETGE
jgi:hypothetical protein